MKDKDQIAAIAVFDGYVRKRHRVEDDLGFLGYYMRWVKGKEVLETRQLPDYLESHDAILPVINKAWNATVLRINGLYFGDELRKHFPAVREIHLASRHDCIKTVCATPRQLAEAFLKTAKKWTYHEDTKKTKRTRSRS